MNKLLTSCLLLLTMPGLPASWAGVSAAATAPNAVGHPLERYRHPAAAGLVVTPGSLAAFTTTVGAASFQQGVYVSGTELTSSVTATAPAGFEVSWTSGANFGTSQILTQSGGTFTNVPLYIRLTGTALGSYSGNVTLTSPGAAPQVVAVSGTVSVISNPNPVAVVTSIAPSTGNAGIPTMMDIYGTNFVPGVTVSLAPISNSSTYFTVGPTTFISSTHVTALVRSGATTITVRGSVTASNPGPGGGGSTPPNTAVYTAVASPPVITTFSPTSGPVGTRVHIEGYNIFVSSGGTTYNSSVSFNGTAAGGFTPADTYVDAYVPTGATTGFITVTNPNGGAVSAIPFVVTTPRTGFFEDFEKGVKTAYAPASVQLTSGGWTFGEALIGTTAGADKFNDTRSARLRGGGFIEMDTDKANGAGTVTVSAANYSTETGASLLPEISSDGGVTYTSLLGSSPAPTLTSTLTQYSFVANRAGNIRLRFSSSNRAAATNPRISLDDIGITNFSIVTGTRPSTALAALQVYPNPAHDYVMLAGGPSSPLQVTLYDLLGRTIIASHLLAPDSRLALPTTLPAGTYLLKVSGAGEQRAFKLHID
ncbi:MAG: T9SS type A sorting domain-containing protein [Hymenobacter sp.]|nr:MAG: T9SS type A sorting domain-containing protein [Hymenobacter sp.]